MNIVLLEPEIPSNTGNIARTCVCTNSRLHLIRPLGFSLSEKQLLRAGMDYWHLLDVTVYDDLNDFITRAHPERIWYATTKGKQTYVMLPTGPMIILCSARNPRAFRRKF